jgi:tetratricopeptide (TPR) repeat protein
VNAPGRHRGIRNGGLLVCLLVLAPLALGQGDWLAQASKLFEQQRWTEAAQEFQRIEEARPGQTEARLFVGKSFVHLNRFPEAGAALESYLQQHSDSAEALYLLAYVRFRENRPEESLQISTRAARISAPTSDDLKVVGLDYLLLKDHASAIRYLRMGVAMQPNNVEALYALGRVLYEENQFDAAIEALQAVLRLDSRNVKAQDNLGLCFEGKNEMDRAMSAYRKAIEMDRAANRHTAQPYLNLGMALARTDHPEQAVPLLQRAVELDPDSAKAHMELGRALMVLSRLPEAVGELERSVRLKSDDASSHYLLGRVYLRLNKSELGKKELAISDEIMKAKQGSGMSGMARRLKE